MPHLQAASLATTDSQELRSMACDACWYLLARGDPYAAHGLAINLRQQWRCRFGDDHENTLSATRNFAAALRDMSRCAEAHALNEDTLGRRRRVLGDDHPDTLTSASNLAVSLSRLGEYQAARELDEDTLGRRRGMLGDDHPDANSWQHGE
jgi:hypothetical protein